MTVYLLKQSLMCPSSLLISIFLDGPIKVSRFEYNIVSSAYTENLYFVDVNGMSFKYNINSNGPKSEACGTP